MTIDKLQDYVGALIYLLGIPKTKKGLWDWILFYLPGLLVAISFYTMVILLQVVFALGRVVYGRLRPSSSG